MMMRQRAELRIPLEDIASYFKPDHVPYEAKMYGQAWEGGTQRDPELRGVIV